MGLQPGGLKTAIYSNPASKQAMGGTELRREGRESSHRLFHMLTSFLRKQGEEQLALMSCCLETENLR